MRAEIGSTPRTAGIGPVQDFSFSSFFDSKGSIFDKNRVENRYIQFGPLLSLLFFFFFPFFLIKQKLLPYVSLKPLIKYESVSVGLKI